MIDGMGTRVSVGRVGEELAERFLKRLGYRLLERRFRLRNGEIDLVMLDEETIVFVEVRRRTSARCGDPLESVGPRKRAFIVRAARVFLAVRKLHDRPCRFDVIAVRDGERGSAALEHVVDAFRAD